MKRIITSSFVVFASVAGLAACGSDPKPSSSANSTVPKTAAASEASAAPTTDMSASPATVSAPDSTAGGGSSSGGSGVAAIDEFCASADDIVARMKQPGAATDAKLIDELGRLNSQVIDLTRDHPADAYKIAPCTQKIADAMSGKG